MKKMMTFNTESLYWMTNKEWFYVDKKENCFKMKETAPAKAKISFEIWSGKRKPNVTCVKGNMLCLMVKLMKIWIITEKIICGPKAGKEERTWIFPGDRTGSVRTYNRAC